MAEKLKKPEYRRMYGVLKENLARNFGKGFFAVFLFEILQIVFLSLEVVLLSGPASSVFFPDNSGAPGIGGTVLLAALLFVAQCFVGVLTFGLISYVTELVLNKKAGLADLFCGFFEKTGRVWQGAALHALIYLVAAGILALIAFLNSSLIASVMEDISAGKTDSLFKLAGIGSVIFIFILIVLEIPFLFAWNIIREDSSVTVSAAFKKSFSLMIRNYFHFAGYIIFVNLKNLAIIAVIYALTFFIPQKVFKAVPVIMALMNFYLFVQQYTVLMKIYFALPVYYYSLLSINGFIPQKQNLKQQNLLPGDTAQ